MTKKAGGLFLSFTVIGFLMIYFFWPKYEKLPVLGSVSDFQLQDVQGSTYQLNNKKVKIVTFFYTRCPDICPMTIVDLTKLQAQLQKEGVFGEKVELVTISLDPEHDTPEAILKYSQAFNTDPSGWEWLRGTEEETKEIATRFNMQYQKLEGDFFSHSITMYLLDEKNQIRALYDMANANDPLDTTQILGDISVLIPSGFQGKAP
ncbi:SCO family protein [Bacillus sp. RO1]|uniref:SCO family protein n=1 Tax=Bacillus sp. RO1 TaxID=2722703 RepID=UPI001456C53F|nr:SCO family protein [Bacillus sp. RO1]NLP52492.1 SCO family protein [Bacillus sp. RO1]